MRERLRKLRDLSEKVKKYFSLEKTQRYKQKRERKKERLQDRKCYSFHTSPRVPCHILFFFFILG